MPSSKVKSAAPACRDARRVVLFEKVPKHRIGTAKTSPAGKWRVAKPHDHPGLFFAKVKKKTLTDGAICKPDRSLTLSV